MQSAKVHSYQTLISISFFIAVITISACSSGPDLSTPQGIASDCAGKAYDTIFFGGSYYDYEDRGSVVSALRSDSNPGGVVSEEAMRRLVNAIGSDASQSAASGYTSCVQQGLQKMEVGS